MFTSLSNPSIDILIFLSGITLRSSHSSALLQPFLATRPNSALRPSQRSIPPVASHPIADPPRLAPLNRRRDAVAREARSASRARAEGEISEMSLNSRRCRWRRSRIHPRGGGGKPGRRRERSAPRQSTDSGRSERGGEKGRGSASVRSAMAQPRRLLRSKKENLRAVVQ